MSPLREDLIYLEDLEEDCSLHHSSQHFFSYWKKIINISVLEYVLKGASKIVLGRLHHIFLYLEEL